MKLHFTYLQNLQKCKVKNNTYILQYIKIFCCSCDEIEFQLY